jgi:aryl-alcohol dehydrogenase-like predicted oxidoreductase
VLLRARIGLGTLRLDDEDAAATATIAAALDAGIRVFDTARAYGESERRLGAALAAYPDAQVITKGGMARPGGQWRADGRAATLRRDCEESLRALGRPIDLYLVHAPDPRVAWATTMRALRRIADEKLVRAIGVSNVTLRELDEALALAPIAAVEVGLSLLEDLPLRSGVLARCRERDLALIAHSPLGGPRRAAKLLATPILAELARAHAVAPAAIALAALVAEHPEVVAIPGARTPAQAQGLAAAEMLVLDAAERAAIAEAFAPKRVQVAAAGGAREVLLVFGIPGAGKSRTVEPLVADGWERLNRDELGGTLPALARRLDERLGAGVRRVVLDNTYVTRASRAEVLAVAARHGASVRGLFLDAPLAEAQVNVVRRMLAAHGRLLGPDELRRGRDNTALAPTALFRMLRTLEPPADEEGFAALERRPFAREPEPGQAARFVTLDLADGADADSFVIGWAPDAPPSLEAELAARFAGVALCRHGGGPPVCWCRPPLPGLPLLLAHLHGLDPTASELHGTTATHRTLAAAIGARFVQR